MVPDDKEKVHRLDDINKRLYGSDEKNIPRHRQGVLHQINHTVSSAWNDDRTQKVVETVQAVSTNSSFFKKFFVGAIVFFVFAMGIGLYMFFGGSGNVSSDNIQLGIFGNAFTPGGEELKLSVEIANANAVPLEYADLIIEYGKNKADLSDPSDIARIRQDVGTIAPGKVVSKKINLLLYGKEGTQKDVKFTLQYRLENSNAIFQKEKMYQVTINTAPITITTTSATATTSDQPYAFLVSITPNVRRVIPNMMLKVEYPTGFKFTNSEPTPAYLSNVWNLGDLQPGETRQIKIVGTLSGQDGEERSFRALAGSQDPRDKNAIGVTFTSLLHTVDIVRPFLEAHLALNGDRNNEVIARPRSTINATVAWGNNLPTRILDGEVVVKIIGDLVDKSSVQTQDGFYNSVENTITWNQNTTPVFSSIDPGESGSLGFTFTTKSLTSGGQLVIDPQIVLDVSIKGKEPQEGTFSKTLDSFERKTIKFATDFQITGQAFYYSGPFTNNGPIPPRVDQKTTYTIRWSVTNSSNEVTNGIARATLPAYVHFLNVINPTTEDLKVDPINGDLIWKIGSIPKGTGYGSTKAKEVFFQVEFTPSISQLNKVPVLVNELNATATDAYTNTPLSSKWNAITTQLYNDSTYNPGDEKVNQ